MSPIMKICVFSLFKKDELQNSNDEWYQKIKIDKNLAKTRFFFFLFFNTSLFLLFIVL